VPRCPHYRPRGPDDRVCVDFFDEYEDLTGACSRDDEFMCVEWARVWEGYVDGDLVQIRKKPRRPAAGDTLLTTRRRRL
jgi:hypothetical protein